MLQASGNSILRKWWGWVTSIPICYKLYIMRCCNLIFMMNGPSLFLNASSIKEMIVFWSHSRCCSKVDVIGKISAIREASSFSLPTSCGQTLKSSSGKAKREKRGLYLDLTYCLWFSFSSNNMNSLHPILTTLLLAQTLPSLCLGTTVTAPFVKRPAVYNIIVFFLEMLRRQYRTICMH